MHKSFAIGGGRITEEAETQGHILVFCNPDENERHLLVEQMNIDAHNLQSSVDPDEIARLEVEPDHVAMIFKRPKNYSEEDQLVFKVSSMGIFWSPKRLIVVVPEDYSVFEGRPFQKIASIQDVVLRLLQQTILHYLGHLRTINMISDSLEQKVNRAMENRYLLNLFALEKGLTYYVSSIHSNMAVIEKLRALAPKISLSEEQIELLDDLIIENQQCFKQAEISSSIFASLMDARASIVNNNLNVFIMLQNIITIAIMVPTFVVSIYGMNVPLPFAGIPHAFWIVMGMSGAALAIFMTIWRVMVSRRNR
jgi:magnesium transporter